MIRLKSIARSLSVASAIVSLVCLTLPVAASAQASPSITVFAAASLTEALNAAAVAFTRKTGVAVTFDYGGSDTLATQIDQGAPADVFASANLAQMKVVSLNGNVLGTPSVFAKNRLVVVTPKSDHGKVNGIVDLAKSGVKVVLAAATVPVGGYARKTFTLLAGKMNYPLDFASAVEKNVVSNELDVKAVVTKITLGEGDAGVCYSTDVTPNVAPKLTVFPFPSSVAPDIEYPIATLKNAKNPTAARAFVDFLTSAQGQQYLKARGFISP